MKPYWIRAAEFSGLDPDQDQMDRMEQYGDWLRTEAVRSGGIGPTEVGRIDRRHLADSVLFASQLPDSVEEVWDLGSGVGLPGIPLAICLPATRIHLVDRSGRRLDLMRRVLRILDLRNCQVSRGDIADLRGPVPNMVARASLPPAHLREVGESRLAPGGVLVVGGSWHEPPEHAGWTTVEIPRDVLDQPVWLLIMRSE